MINTRGIKARLIERGASVADLADNVGRSYSVTLAKLNGRTALTLNEAEQWQAFMGIDDAEFAHYFMNHGR